MLRQLRRLGTICVLTVAASQNGQGQGNQIPVGVSDSYVSTQGQALSIAAPGVLSNDTDGNGDTLTTVIVTATTNGTLALNPNGGFSYTPNAGFTGTDTFTYRANDGIASSNPTTVTLRVCPCSIWTAATTPAVPAANDSGAVEIGMKFRSTQSGNITGVRFYKGSTNKGTHVGKLWSATGTLLASVTFTGETASGWQQALFPSPVAIAANTTYVISYYAPIGRYSFNGSYFSSAVNNFPMKALANGEDGGNGVYVYGTGGGFPVSTFNAGNYWVDPVFTPTPLSGNSPPISSNDSYSTLQGQTLSIAAPGVLSNDSDPNGDTITAILASNPANGTLTLNPNGSFTYVPPAAFTGTVSFGYKANDGTLDSAVATVSITVTASGQDTTPPSVSITSPTEGAAISAPTTVGASASDNVSVAGVRFYIDGAALGQEDTSAPYTTTLNPAGYGSGPHVLTAVARDTAGNTATSAVRNIVISNQSDPATVGAWSAVASWPVVGIHTTLLNNGLVLAFEGHGFDGLGIAGGVWNPATGSFTQIAEPISDIFCAGHVVLADGRVLVAGGHGTDGHLGIADVNIFNPATNSWTSAPPMAYRRWYPTATVLPDGRVLIVSGADLNDRDYVPIPEIYNPVTNSWTSLVAASTTVPSYSHLFVMPNGNVAYTGSDEARTDARSFNVSSQTWTTIDPTLTDGGSSVMYDFGKFMKSGTAADDPSPPPDSARSTFVIDFSSPNPTFQQTADMAFPRSFHNLTILPDGNVLVTSGSQKSNKSIPVLDAELWSPGTKTWQTLSKASVARTYHSNALLLPDGRILVSGSGRNSGMVDERNYELFSPPYLFKGVRPVISSAPDVLSYTGVFSVGTSDPTSITSVVLMRPGSFTHQIDMEQRRVPLTFSQAPGGLSVVAPATGAIAPPGYYMLFLLNSAGVPSIGRMVRLPSPSEDTQPPTAPQNLFATGSIGTVALTWSASTDNNGVDRYNVHRSASAGFTPNSANRIAQTQTTSLSDTGLTAGTYYYKVTAQDANGNISGPSPDAVAYVSADTTPPTVSLTAPFGGTTVSGTVVIAASASDDAGVAGVQFLLDGLPLGSEDTSAPYSFSWNTVSTANGTHQLAARARDTGGNTATSAVASVSVSNAGPSGAVAYYGFEEASGTTVLDSTGNQNNGAIAGAARIAGKYGSGLSFNGTTSMVSINSSTSLELTTGMTIMAWVNPSALNGYRTVIMKEVPGESAWAIDASDSSGKPGLWIRVGGRTYAAKSPSALPLNTWSHVAGTYDGIVMRFFVNGTQVGTQNIMGAMQTSTNPLRLGGNSIWGEYFAGLMDEVRVLNRAMSQSEIAQAMSSPIVP